MRQSLFFFFFFFLIPTVLSAQSQAAKTDYYKIVLEDDNVFYGTLVYQDSVEVQLDAEQYGRMVFRRSTVARLVPMTKEQYEVQKKKRARVYNSYQQEFFGQTGFGPKAGETTYRNVYLLANDFEVGITDFLSIQAGFTWTFLIPDGDVVTWLTPKVHLPLGSDKVSTSLSLFYIKPFGDFYDSDDYSRYLLSSTSIRKGKSQFTMGVGVGKDGFEESDLPLLTLSAQIHLGRKAMLITENYFVRNSWDNIGAYSLGVRLVRRVQFDLGLGLIQDDYGDVFPVPVVAFRAPLK